MDMVLWDEGREKEGRKEEGCAGRLGWGQVTYIECLVSYYSMFLSSLFIFTVLVLFIPDCSRRPFGAVELVISRSVVLQLSTLITDSMGICGRYLVKPSKPTIHFILSFLAIHAANV